MSNKRNKNKGKNTEKIVDEVITEEVKTEEVKEEMTEEVKEEMTEEVKEEMTEEVKEEMTEEVKEEMTEEVKEEMTEPKKSKFNIVEEIVMGGSGGGKGHKDSSDELNYAEKLILSDDFIEALMGLKVAYKEGDSFKGGFILLQKDDVPEYFTTGKESSEGLTHMINKVFVASKSLPFKAESHRGKGAQFADVVSKGSDKKASHGYKVSQTVRVFRVSEKFDINKYVVEGSTSFKGKNPYHTPTDKSIERVQKIIREKELHF